MNKKVYNQPATRVVKTQFVSMLAQSGGGNSVNGVSGNASLHYGGGGNGAALSRDGGWDEDDE